jgi:hypothetical protein
MWIHLPSASMAHGAAHRRAAARLLTLSVGLGLIAASIPAATTLASSHDDPDLILGTPDTPGTSPLDVSRFRLQPGDGRLIVHPADADADADLGAWLLVGCEVNGHSYGFGANSADEPFTLDVSVPGAPPGLPIEIPAAGPGGPAGFTALDPLDCGEVDAEPVARLPKLTGVSKFDGVGRNCPRFSTDVAFTDHKPFGDYDTFTMGGNPPFPIVHTNPLVAIDESNAFDDFHLIAAGLDGNGSATIPGVTLGGGPGTLPSRKKVERLISEALDDQDTDLVEKLQARVEANKTATPLIKAIGAKGNPCSYATKLALDPGQDPAAMSILVGAVQPPPMEVTAPPRFGTQLTWSDGEPTDLEQLRVFVDDGDVTDEVMTDGLDGPGPDAFWFFAPDNWEVLVKVLDGCSVNDRFWVFYGSTTNVGYELTVTDTETGDSRAYEAPVAPFQPILDTEAFATCP